MTSKQRALAALGGGKPDRVPVHHLQFSGDAARVLLGREAFVGGAAVQWQAIQCLWKSPDAYDEFLARCQADAVAVARACGHDILRLHYWRWAGGRPAARLDEWTFAFGDYPDGRWHRLTYDPLIELLTRRDYRGAVAVPAPERPDEPPQPDEDALRARALAEEAATEAYRPDTATADRFAALYRQYPDDLLKLGTETVYVDMNSTADLLAVALYPRWVARIEMARARRLAMDLPALAAAGMQANFTGYDFCSKDGPCISPAAFEAIYTPALRHLVEAAHAVGMKYSYSGDGNFAGVAQSLFDRAGCDFYFETDRSAGMELRALRRQFPRVGFIGNIRAQVLHRGSRDDVVRETLDALGAAHEHGGIVVGVSNMIMPGTPPENLLAMLRTIEANR